MKTVKSTDWIQIANRYIRDNTAKQCPVCKSENGLDFHIACFGRTSFTIICKVCGACAHIDEKTESDECMQYGEHSK